MKTTALSLALSLAFALSPSFAADNLLMQTSRRIQTDQTTLTMQQKNTPSIANGEIIVGLKASANINNTAGLRLSATQLNLAHSKIAQNLAKFGFRKSEALLKDNPNQGLATVVRTASATDLAQRNHLSNLQLVSVAAGQELAAIQALQNMPEVAYAEPNIQIKLNAYTPNDPYYFSTGSWGQNYKDLWGHYSINAQTAWNLTQGQGVTVAVIDTGLDINHPDIQGNIWTNPNEIANNGIDDDQNGYIDDVHGWNFYHNNNNVQDENGHGSHVAGIIAASGNNNIGIVGVAPAAKILPVRVFDRNGNATMSGIINAIIYAADNGAQILNNSYGGMGVSQAQNDAMAYAYNKGALPIVAAGNDNWNAAYTTPANSPFVVTVGATQKSVNAFEADYYAYFSNYGAHLDIAAPGQDILSLNAANSVLAQSQPSNIVNNNYLRLSGTSMATPYVAGMAALIKARNPSYTPAQISYALSTISSSPSWKIYQGYTPTPLANIGQSINISQAADLKVAITSPNPYQEGNNNHFIKTTLALQGTAMGSQFARYTVSYKKIDPSAAWSDSYTQLYSATTPVQNATLANLNLTNLATGEYSIRVSVFDTLGKEVREHILINIDPKRADNWPKQVGIFELVGSWNYLQPSLVPLFVDLNKDGKKEIIVTDGHTLFAWDVAGNPIASFPKPIGAGDLATQMAVSDLNGDGSPEIVTNARSFSNGLFVFDQQGNPVNGFPVSAINGNSQNDVLAVGDITGDGKDEIIISNYGFNNNLITVHAYGENGQIKSGWPISLTRGANYGNVSNPIALADLDNNGSKEIIIANGDTQFSIYNGAGTLLRSINMTFPSNTIKFTDHIAVADFTGDGKYDLARLAIDTPSGAGAKTAYLYLIDLNTGAVQNGWPQAIAGQELGNARLFPLDTNNDGINELFLQTFVNGNRLYGFNGQGQTLSRLSPNYPLSGAQAAVATAHLAGVGASFIHLEDNAKSYVVDKYDGTETLKIGNIVGISADAGLSIEDLDGDGTLESVWVSETGMVYMQKLSKDSNAPESKYVWNTYLGNMQRSSSLAIRPVNPSNIKRTIIFMYGQTVSGQDMFLRGGIDHTYAASIGRICTNANMLCALPIQHLNTKNATTNPWKTGDTYLDWYGLQAGQASSAQGTPLDWTSNTWPANWGASKSVAVDGYGVSPLNTWGPHYWMLDVMMDCSKTVNNWFEIKSFISGSGAGTGWENDVNQAGRPYASGNHFAQCGKLNMFKRGDSSALIQAIP